MWHPDNSDNQWWVDAFTIEPTSLLTHSTVISKRGMKQDAVENPWANASVGTMPKVMVYIAACSAWRVCQLGQHWVHPWWVSV
jgi:hypothetical protein